MEKEGTIPNLPQSLQGAPTPITCASCAHARQQPQPHQSAHHSQQIAEQLSSDTCGPISPPSTHGNVHIFTCIDTASRYLVTYCLRRRQEVNTIIPQLFKTLDIQNKLPRAYRTDSAKEFTSSHTKATYSSHGIQHITNTPHQPQENSIAERINKTLFTNALAALHHAALPPQFWEDAVRDVAFKYNIMRHSATQQSPWTLWHGRQAHMTCIFTFGQIGTAPVHAHKTKLQGQSEPARYMYPISETHVMTRTIRNSRYRIIRAIDFRPYARHQDPKYTSSQAFKVTPSRHKTHQRTRTPTRLNPPPSTIDATTPATRHFHAARQYPDAQQWAAAHNDELDTLEKQRTIKWIPETKVPPGEKLIPLTMTYRYKRTPEGKIAKRKARCSIRGDHMKAGQHFDPKKTSTFMAEKTTVRTLLSIAAANQWPV